MILNMTMMMDEDDGDYGDKDSEWMVLTIDNPALFTSPACFLSPVVTLRTHSLFSITINIVGLLIFGSEWGEESNYYFQF